MLGAIDPLPSTPSWRGAQLKKSTETTLPLLFTLVQVFGTCRKVIDKMTVSNVFAFLFIYSYMRLENNQL